MSLVPLHHKAAGHPGPMQTTDGLLFIKPTTKQEIEFYSKTQEKKMSLGEDIPYGNSISDWMPDFVGVLYPGASNDLIRETDGQMDENLLNKAIDTLEIEGEDKQYLVLNNCLHGFSKPSIMDIKLGSILYDSSANSEKVKRMKLVSKQTTSGSLQFRIAGMVISDDFDGKLPDEIPGFEMDDVSSNQIEKGYITFNKYFGRKLTEHNISEGLKIFFRYNKLPENIQNLIIENFYTRLQMMYNCLLDEEIRVVSGSLLFIYENDMERWKGSNFEDPIIQPPLAVDEDGDEEEEEDDDEEYPQGIKNDEGDENTIDNKGHSDIAPLSCLKFIDFAHARYTPKQGHDEEIVSGIENLFGIIENI